MTGHRIDFSDDEKAYISANAPYRSSWGALARDLERKFPEHNQGRRNSISIRNWYRVQVHREGERVTVEADVPKSLAVEIQRAGLSPVEVGQILADGLRKRASV